MKAKQLAKRLRKRSDDFHRMALSYDSGDATVAERARLIGDVLQEVADQVAPPSKKIKKAKKKHNKDKSKKLLPRNGEALHAHA